MPLKIFFFNSKLEVIVSIAFLALPTCAHANLQRNPIISLCVPSPPQYNDMNQWLQVELPQIKKITGIITQGAKSLGTEMYVISYTLQYSNNGIHWNQYTDDEGLPFKVSYSNQFTGNWSSLHQ